MNKLSLLVLAAGMGSRYGGLKQLDPVGPEGQVLMEYSIADAARAGVDKIVFVIRRDFEEVFREDFLPRVPRNLEVALTFQDTHDLPGDYASRIDPGRRVKPWGTGHAVWSARHALGGAPFISINADDYYGPMALHKLVRHLTSTKEPNPCMVGFRLRHTLSPSGTVSRGICEVDDGRLLRIRERTKLHALDSDTARDEAVQEEYPLDVLVSMNCWGFGADFIPFLEEEFSRFLDRLIKGEEDPARGEFYLPEAVELWRLQADRPVTVEVSDEPWLGVTYPEDKPRVVEALKAVGTGP